MKYLPKHIVGVVFLCLIAAGCSVGKDRFTNRLYHRSVGWFNTLFNGEEALKKSIKDRRNNFKEDYSSILPVVPEQPVEQKKNDFNDSQSYYVSNKKRNFFSGLARGIAPGKPDEDQNISSGNMFEYAEKKAIKTIENHAMLIRGKERNTLIARAYLLLGISRYYQGESYGALDAFNYILNNIKGSKQENEVRFWRAKANFQAGNEFYALESLIKLYEKPHLKRGLKEKTAALYSRILIDKGKYEIAVKALDKAKQNTKDKTKKARYTFVQGQLENRLGNYPKSSKLFDQVSRYRPGFDMAFQAKMSIANNFVPEKNNYNAFQQELKKMLKNNKYDDLKDQIYYSQGLIAERSKKTDQAEKFFRKALSQKSSSERIKSLTYAHTGNVFFEKQQYIQSARYYDSAFEKSKSRKIKDFLGQRKIYLKELIENYKLVKNNDSILKLASLTPKEQKIYVDQYIKRLKKQEEQKKQAIEEQNRAYQSLDPSSAFDNKHENKKTFYFYNDNIVNRGKQKFRQRWGDRQLADNWRVSDLATINPSQKQQEQKSVETAKDKPYDADKYLSQIPKNQNVIARMKSERDSAQFNMGIIYLDKIKNNERSVTTFEELLKNQPERDLKAKIYYNLYRALEDNPERAKKYKKILIDEFPQTSYAIYVKNPKAKNFVTQNSKESIALYKETFRLYKSTDYKQCQELISRAIKKYGDQKIIAKFSLLNAYIEGKTKGKKAMLSALENIVLVYRGFPEADKAQQLLKINKMMNLQNKLHLEDQKPKESL